MIDLPMPLPDRRTLGNKNKNLGNNVINKEINNQNKNFYENINNNDSLKNSTIKK